MHGNPQRNIMKRVFGLLVLLAGGPAALSFHRVTADNDHSTASVQPMPALDHLPSFPGARKVTARRLGAGEAAKSSP